MYAVIETGGKQYRVAAGDTIRVEKLAGEVGAEVEFDKVLAVFKDAEPMLSEPEAVACPGKGGHYRPRPQPQGSGLQVQTQEAGPADHRPPPGLHQREGKRDSGIGVRYGA